MAKSNAYPVSPDSSLFPFSEDVDGTSAISLAKDSNDALSLAFEVSAGEALRGGANSVPFTHDEAISHMISAPPPAPPSPALLPQPMEIGLHGTSPSRFLTQTYDMIEDVASNSVVSWSSENNSFIVWSLSEFCENLLPRYYKHNNFSSFVRQLNIYGFKKVRRGRYEFAHEYFLRGQKHLLKDIHRRKTAGLRLEHKKLEQQRILSVAENGMFGLEGAIDHLQGDKRFLVSEIMKLKQQQQTMEKEAHALADRAQALETRHERITKFLARIRNTAFLAHFQLQSSEVYQIESEAKKRRCLFSSMNDIDEFMEEISMQTSEDTMDFCNKSNVGEVSELDRAGLEYLRHMVSELAPLCSNTGQLWEGLRTQLLEAVGNRENFPVNGCVVDPKADFLFLQRVDGANELKLNFDLKDFTQELSSVTECADLGAGLSPDSAQGNVSHKLQKSGEGSLKRSLTSALEEQDHSIASVDVKRK